MREFDCHPLPAGTWYVSSGYGWRARGFHHGVDLAAPQGTPLRAPWPGVVRTGFEAGGAGNWVWVTNSDGDFVKYFHCQRFEVTSGHVAAGDVVAYVGSTGSSTGPHVHVELWGSDRSDPTGHLERAGQPAPAPAPEPEPEDDLEDEDMRSRILEDGERVFECWGPFKRWLGSQDEINLHLFLGAVDARGANLDGQRAILGLLTEIPRGKIAGTDG